MEHLNHIANGLRSLFQELLREFVRDKAEREQLAKVLGRTPGHIKQMIYKGEGGLDSWAKAFAYYYNLDVNSLTKLRQDFGKKSKISAADRLWFSIREDLGANEADLFYLAKCAHEAFRIKSDVTQPKKATKKIDTGARVKGSRLNKR